MTLRYSIRTDSAHDGFRNMPCGAKDRGDRRNTGLAGLLSVANAEDLADRRMLNCSIRELGYPESNTFTYYDVGGNLNTTTILTDKAIICRDALSTVQKEYPYAAMPEAGSAGDLEIYDVDGGLANHCYYVV